MPANKKHILSTISLSRRLLEKATENDIIIDTLSFIEIVPFKEHAVREKVRTFVNRPICAIFTSVNAVSIVCSHVDNQASEWEIYCTGNTTRKEVIRCFGQVSIKGTGDNAATVAKLILADQVKEVVFFCGDSRRDTLPDLLKKAGIKVTEIIVYKTDITPHVINGKYDAILFFSPLAAASFFSCNTIDTKATLFAIGNTTAEAIKTFSTNPLIVCPKPGKALLIDEVINHFAQKNDL